MGISKENAFTTIELKSSTAKALKSDFPKSFYTRSSRTTASNGIVSIVRLSGDTYGLRSVNDYGRSDKTNKAILIARHGNGKQMLHRMMCIEQPNLEYDMDFGSSLAITDDSEYVFVGAQRYAWGNLKQGCIYVFQRHIELNKLKYKFAGVITNVLNRGYYGLGEAIAVSGDGSTLAFTVSSTPEAYSPYQRIIKQELACANIPSRYVYVYKKKNNKFTYHGKAYVNHEAGYMKSGFGASLSLDYTGSTLAIGHTGYKNIGGAFICRVEDMSDKSKDHPIHQIIMPPHGSRTFNVSSKYKDYVEEDGTYRLSDKRGYIGRFSEKTGESLGGFGSSIALSRDGTRMVVGSPKQHNIGSSVGIASVFTKTDTGWRYVYDISSRYIDQFGSNVTFTSNDKSFMVYGESDNDQLGVPDKQLFIKDHGAYIDINGAEDNYSYYRVSGGKYKDQHHMVEMIVEPFSHTDNKVSFPSYSYSRVDSIQAFSTPHA